MKKLITLLLFFTTSLFYAQDLNIDTPMGSSGDDPIYNSAGLQVQPEYPGGMAAFYDYFHSKLKKDQLKDVQEEKLRVIITFVVEKNGSVTNIKVLRDPGYGIKEQSLKILQSMSKWKPGQQDGKPVRAQFTLPITITPNDKK